MKAFSKNRRDQHKRAFPILNVLIDDPKDAEFTFIFAHGAGAGMAHDFMQSIATNLAEKGVRVIRFNFPYMVKRTQEGKKYLPDKLPILLDAFIEVIEKYAGNKTVIGGKSMGGRVASHVGCFDSTPYFDAIKGIACLGFPFHPPKKPEKNKGAHLGFISKPTLILQGERDAFGGREILDHHSFSKQVSFSFIPDGCHGFKPRKASGYTEMENRGLICQHLFEFIKKVSNENH